MIRARLSPGRTWRSQTRLLPPEVRDGASLGAVAQRRGQDAFADHGRTPRYRPSAPGMRHGAQWETEALPLVPRSASWGFLRRQLRCEERQYGQAPCSSLPLRSRRGRRVPRDLVGPEKSCGKRQLCFVLLPQGFPDLLGQIVKTDPHVASGRTGKVFSPNLPVFLREIGIVAVGVECLRIDPLNIGSLRVDVKPNCFA